MLGALLKDASGVTDRRFFVNALLPCVLFCGLALLVVLSAERDLGNLTAAWHNSPAGVKALQAVAFLATASLLACGLASQRTTILRWFEGYWTTAIGRVPARIGRRHHCYRHARLGEQVDEGDAEAYEAVYLWYPPLTQPGQVMPTRPGDALKSAELYSNTRYSIDAVITWPRLYHHLPERFLSTFSPVNASD